MSNKPKSDPRVRRTKQLLQTTLQTLLVEKPFEKITVSEIVKRADVARTTFYAHFESKEALLSTLWEDVHVTFFAELDTQISQGAIEVETVMLVFFRAIMEMRPLLETVHETALDLLLLEQIQQLIAQALIRGRGFEGIAEWELSPYLGDAITGVLFMVSCRWVRDGMVIPAETLAKLVARYSVLSREIEYERQAELS